MEKVSGESNSNIHLALVHFPVYNKSGEVIVSSVTTLDVHDISRVCRTYGVGTFYVITPLKTQQELVERLVSHWLTGHGAEYNPTRKEALLKTVVKNNLDEVVKEITEETGIINNSDENNIWIIDPIDGTTNFLHGIPHFAISIALKSNNEII